MTYYYLKYVFWSLYQRLTVMSLVALSVVLSMPAPLSAQTAPPVAFEAMSVTVDNENNLMTAQGQVRIIQNGQVLTADKIIYNQQTGIAQASGHVQITDEEGIEHRADNMVLDENFTHAIATPLITILADSTRFSSASGDYKKGKRTIFGRSVFSPCKCDYDAGETPIWDLRTTKSRHNYETKTITHSHVTMHIFGLPVFYMPILAHADNSVRRRSGLLTPTTRYSHDQGFTHTLPYYHVISPTQDVEFRPTNFQFRGQALETIYRQKWDNSDLEAKFYGGDLETFKNSRDNVAAVDLAFNTKVGTGWDVDVDIQRTSQDTFLRRYGYKTDTHLVSALTAQKITPDRYYAIKASDFQGLRETDDHDKELTILPSIYYEKIRKGAWKNQTIRTELSAMQIDNDHGHEMVRWTSLIGTHIKNDYNGHVLAGTADLMGSYHDVQKTNNPQDKLPELGQGHVIVTGEWSYPLGVMYGRDRRGKAREGKDQEKRGKQMAIVSPKIKLTHITGTDRTEAIPNRDSTDFRLDEANIFLANRFQGRDFIQPGTHLAGGLSAVAQDKYLGAVTAFVGLSYRASGELADQADLSSDAHDDFSDYVASLSAQTPYNFDLSWAGRIDESDQKLNESRTQINYSYGGTSIDLNHRQIAKTYFTSATSDREEASIILSQDITDDLVFKAEQVWNLSDGMSKKDKSIMSLIWSGGFQDCLTISLDYKRDPFIDRDIKKVSEVQLLISFKHLGSLTGDSLTN